jgi:hypothetical protein
VDVPTLCAFARIDVPQQYVSGNSGPVTADWTLLETFIEAATDQVENMAAQACLYEQVVLTFDFFPNTQDPRNFLNYELSYAYNMTPWWWFGFPAPDSIELVRRTVIPTGTFTVPGSSPAVTNQVVVTYNNQDGNKETFDPANYTVYADKITLNVNCVWPLTDRRQDCIQITYWAGYDASDPTKVPARLKLAVMFLSTHFWENRSIVTVEDTSEVGLTLSRILQPYRSMRIPR